MYRDVHSKIYPYSRQKIKKWVRHTERLLYTRFGKYHSNPSGINVFSQDWDNLVILDACRYDLFAERYPTDEPIPARTSLAGATPEWVRANFDSENLHDVVYITGNAQYANRRDNLNCEFHALHQISPPQGEEMSWLDRQEWNIEKVTEKARVAIDQYPHKRLLIHYPAPHRPFLGEIAREYFTTKPSYRYKPRDMSRHLVWQAYAETFDIVLSEALHLHEDMVGKTIFSSDHGEMLGERHNYTQVPDYGHFVGIYNQILTKVPWYTPDDFTNRRKIIPEPPKETKKYDQESIDQNLGHLGYKT